MIGDDTLPSGFPGFLRLGNSGWRPAALMGA